MQPKTLREDCIAAERNYIDKAPAAGGECGKGDSFLNSEWENPFLRYERIKHTGSSAIFWLR